MNQMTYRCFRTTYSKLTISITTWLMCDEVHDHGLHHWCCILPGSLEAHLQHNRSWQDFLTELKKLLTWSKQPSEVYFGTCVHVDVEVITARDLFLAWSTRPGSCGNCAAVPASCSSTKAHRANKCLSWIPTWQLRRCVVRVAIVRSLEMFSFKNTSDVLSSGYQYLAVSHHISRISDMHIIMILFIYLDRVI